MKEKKHNLESLQRIQCDIQSVRGRFFIPLLLGFVKNSLNQMFPDSSRFQLASEVFNRLYTWDGSADLKSREATFFHVWIHQISLESGLNDRILFNAFSNVLNDEMTSMVARSFRRALDMWELNRFEDIPPWGEVHTTGFNHLSKSPLYDVAPIESAGDGSSVNVGTYVPFQGRSGIEFDQQKGASFRMIVEMSEPPQIFLTLTGENLDRRVRSIQDESGAWMNWRDCKMQRLVWELDGIESKSLSF